MSVWKLMGWHPSYCKVSGHETTGYHHNGGLSAFPRKKSLLYIENIIISPKTQIKKYIFFTFKDKV